MKNYLFSLLAVSLFVVFSMSSVSAQRSSGASSDESLEIKINPIGILFGNADIAVEKIMSESFGLEGALSYNSYTLSAGSDSYNQKGFGLGVFAKYYFNPDRDCSKFYLAPYLRFATTKGTSSIGNSDDLKNTRVAGGLMFGYKWMSQGKVSFELALGFGRAFVNNYSGIDSTISLDLLDIDAVGRLAVGYRL